jgi:hypothetical protein
MLYATRLGIATLWVGAYPREDKDVQVSCVRVVCEHTDAHRLRCAIGVEGKTKYRYKRICICCTPHAKNPYHLHPLCGFKLHLFDVNVCCFVVIMLRLFLCMCVRVLCAPCVPCVRSWILKFITFPPVSPSVSHVTVVVVVPRPSRAVVTDGMICFSIMASRRS